MPRTLTIFGALGATGRRTVAAAREAGHRVRAVEPVFPDDHDVPPDVTRIEADVLEGDLHAAVAGADAVISCLGVGNALTTLASPPPLYTTGTRRILDAMLMAGVSRIVVMSAAFVHQRDLGPLLFRHAVIPSLTRVLAQMQEMEAMLAASSLDWTAVRPGWLMDAPPSGDPWIGPDRLPDDLIRARTGDVAALLVDAATTGAWSRRTPAIARDEPDDREGNWAVAADMLT